MRFQLATHPLFITSVLSVLSVVCGADLQQAIIDDESGDSVTKALVNYTGGWGQGSLCNNCNLKPDTSKAYMGTWHDTTHFAGNATSGVNFEFTGVSLEVFCILPPKDALAILNYSLTFVLDGKEVGTPFIRTPENLTSEYQYNVSVVALQNLTSTKHSFTMELASKDLDTVALFDYAVYQFEATGNSTTSSGSSATSGGAATTSNGGQSTATGPSASMPAQSGSGSNGSASVLRLGVRGEIAGAIMMILTGIWMF
ncbi:hypothetical protein V5O48_001552 [Marasmius crinis-equi]|uniref:Uncharacterized protein n=1 Tax=Marasmius crinis-equi TaxID=585013 RepID=A0ABR3FZC5_9AGAR